MTLLLLTTAASAQSLTWAWPPGTTRTWRIETVVQYSSPEWLRARHNVEGRAERVHTEMIWRCTAGEPGRQGWELACEVLDARLVVDPLDKEADDVAAVLPELDAALTGATVQLQLDRSGHLRGVDLEGQAKDDRRSGAIHETLRLLVARSAAGLDLHLPTNGDLKSTWKQKDDAIYAYPIAFGSLSGARVTHTLLTHDARHVSVRSTGTGTLRVGESAPVPTTAPGAEEPWMLDMRSEAQALFDGVEGTLVARRWVAAGEPLASSGWEVGKPVEPYLQTGVLTALRPGESPPKLGETGLWTVDHQPGEAWRQLLASPLYPAPETP